MSRYLKLSALLLVFAMLVCAQPAMAQQKEKQNRGKNEKVDHKQHDGDKAKAADHKVQAKPQDKAQGKGQGKDKDNRGGVAKVSRDERNDGRGRKGDLRERVNAQVVGRAKARGVRDGDVVITPSGNRITLRNRAGATLIDLDEERARNLGAWRVSPRNDQLKSDAPSFCRSGEGHPVWGRQWCLDKGFGLGSFQGLRWGVTDVTDINIRRVDSGTLARNVLLDVLGDVVFNRLGLHAVTLGYTDPLTGVWLGENTGPRVLRITSGAIPIAEIVDNDRDNRADVLLVALRPL